MSKPFKAQRDSTNVFLVSKNDYKQHYDFKSYDAVISRWENLTQDKREWLWTEKAEYWEYYSLLFQSYIEVGKQREAIDLAAAIIESPATPANGRVWLGTAYANWQMRQKNQREAFAHFDWLVKELPTHPVAAWGYYWQSVTAHAAGNQTLAQEKAAAVRRCFAGRPDFLWQWNLDARALLMQLDFSVDAVLGVCLLYTSPSPRDRG